MRKLIQNSSKLLAFFVALAMTSLVCLSSSFAIETNAGTLLSAEEIVEAMGVGWNLGNSLDSTGASYNGSITDYEQAWGNPVVTEDLIKAVKSKGFNTVRVPVTWYEHITVSGSTYTIDEAWLARVKEVVDYAYNNGMYVILNIHHEEWINRSDLANSYNTMSAELKQVWTQIATYFSGYGQRLIFEGMNEPRAVGNDSIKEWEGNAACYNVVNKLNADFISTVRSVDSDYKTTRLLMVPGYAASCSADVYSNLDMSLFNDPYTAVSIHAYSPYDFTMGEGDHTAFSAAYKAALDSIFGDMRTYFTQNDIPVVIGEFSSSNFGNTSARVEWAEYYMTLAKGIGAACVLWDNNAETNSSNASEAHGYINRSNNTWYSSSESIVNKLISVRNDSSIVWASKSSYPLYSHYDFSSGTAVSVASDSVMQKSEMSKFTSETELAIKYTSNVSLKIALMNGSYQGWTELSPYDFTYTDSYKIAYVKYDDIYGTWDSSTNGDLAYIKVIDSDYNSVSCSAMILNVKGSHTHTPESTYSSDETGHWYTCSGCDEKVDFEEHTEDSGTVTKEPTETTAGVKTYKCTKCEYVIRTEAIDPDGKNDLHLDITKNRISNGFGHSAYITEDGDLYTWGTNDYGKLGYDTGEDGNSLTPKKVMSNVSQVSLGDDYSACITTNGDLYTWGYNYYGQLGDGTTKPRITPKKIMSNVSQVSLGSDYSACITTNGDLYTWGRNRFGQLGDGTTTDSDTPKKIMSNVVQIEFNFNQSSCITTDGSLYIWGYNEYGQLGDGTTTNRSTPKKIMSNVSQVSLGYNHSACITTNGDLYTWGYNNWGQLGDGTTKKHITPIKIKSNVSQVSLGYLNSAYISTDGSLYTWGSNYHGCIGDGTETTKLTPRKIMDSVALVCFGNSNVSCITECGDLYTWGDNRWGQLGDGTKENRLKPVKITTPDMQDHTHDLSTDYSYDEIGHWNACSGCKKKVNFERHTEDEGTITKKPTESEEGERTYKCTKCNFTRTEAIAPLSASPVTVNDGTETKIFDTLTAALTAYKNSTATLTITLNKDAEVKTLSLPAKAAGIVITGAGELNINATSISVPANTTINVSLNGINVKPLAIKVSAGKTLDINGETSNIGAVSGTKTSVLNVNEDMTAASLSTFGEVNIAADKFLTVTGNVSSVTALNGTVKLPSAASSANVTTAGNVNLILTEANGKIAKVTVNNVTGSLELNIVNADGDIVALASGTTVLYSAKDISEKVTVANETADNKPLNAFYYIKTKSIKAEWADAVTLSYGGNDRNFPNLELALAGITDKNTDYTVTLNTDVTAATLTLPKNAKSITINGTGTLTTGSTSISTPVNTTIDCNIVQSAGKKIALKASAGVTLTIDTASDCFGAVSGTKTSVLKVNSDMTASSVSTFGEVTAADGKVLTVTGKLSAVIVLNGKVKLPTTAASAAVTTVGNAEFILTDGAIAKATVNAVDEELKINVVNADGDTVVLASGTTVLYTAGTADYTDKVTIENKTSTGFDLTAFLYSKEIKAEYAGAVTLFDGTENKAYPNVTLPLAAINDAAKDYVLILNEDISAAKLTLPSKAKSLTIKSANANDVKTLSLTGITSLSAKIPLTLENVKIESTKAFTIIASKDLTLDNFISDSVSAVKGGSKFVLDLGKTGPIDKISGFGTINLNAEFKVGTTFTTTALNLGEDCGITVPAAKSSISAKTINGAEGSYIKFEQGFTPVKISGTTADSITGTIKLKADGEISESTVLFTSKIAGNGVFDVTEIQPAGSAFGYTAAAISGKVYIKPIILDLDGAKYALWTDVIAAIEAAKAGTVDYTVTLLDNYNIGGAMKLPKAGTYGSLTITSENKTLSFTGSISSTGALKITNTSLDSLKNGVSVKYSANAGKYPFSAENINFNLASGLSGTGDVTLKNVTLNGTLKAGILTLNGTNTVLGTVSAYELKSTESGTVLNILNNSKGVMSITKNGITEGSEDITVRLINADGSAVTAAEGAIIASSLKGSYDGQIKLSTDNGVFTIVRDSKNRLVLASETLTSTNAFEEEEKEETDNDEATDEEDSSEDDDSDEEEGSSEGEEDTSEEDNGTDESGDEAENDENGDDTSDIPIE